MKIPKELVNPALESSEEKSQKDWSNHSSATRLVIANLLVPGTINMMGTLI